ncbi:serine-rich glycoprotein adhesin, partial [Limosilactobacillus reuteri]
MSKHKNEQENGSKVKLYKTKHGWFSALTRFFKLFSFRSKKEVKPTNFNDLDSLKDKHDSAIPDAYKKGAATMATLLGAGVIGTTSPTEAHAATTTVDQNSHIVGSGSTSTSTSTSQMTGSTSTSTSTTSGSTSTSTVSSTSSSTSTTTSTTGSTSTSQSTGSTSASTSTSIASGSGSTSISNSNSSSTSLTSTSGSLASENSTTDDNVSAIIPTEEAQTSVAQSLLTQNTVNNATTAATAMLYNTNLIQLRAANSNSVTVSNSDEFNSALGNSAITEINLAGDVTSTGTTINNGRNLTINGNNHSIYVNGDGSRTVINNGSVTVNNATVYNGGEHGAFDLEGGVANLIYNGVTAYGGTVVFTDTGSAAANVKTFEVKGNTTINYVSSYQNQSGRNVSTSLFNVNGSGTSQLYIGDHIVVHDGASLTVNGANQVNNNITLKGDYSSRVVTIGENATVNLNGATRGNILIDQLDGSRSGQQNSITVGNGSKVDMEGAHFNILINNQDAKNISFGENTTVNLVVNHSLDSSNKTLAGDGNIVTYSSDRYYTTANGAVRPTINANTYSTDITFGKGSNVTLTADNSNTKNILSADNATITINDPAVLTLNNTGGNAYAAFGSNTVTVNANNTNVQITNDGKVEESGFIRSNTSTLADGKLTANTTDMVNANEQTAVENIINKISDNGTTQVVYNGWSIPSQSTSTSIEQSQSTSKLESLSNSVSTEHSQSASTSIEQSRSTSAVTSESLSNAVSMSESLSNSALMSESLSNAVSMSESVSHSVSMSESLSNSVSMSKSMSNSVSMSESLSNSVSMSESLSNSVSMSESLSNSVSMSESLSNSVSMSESLSNSVSMSESLSNSVSMSESLSNS